MSFLGDIAKAFGAAAKKVEDDKLLANASLPSETREMYETITKLSATFDTKKKKWCTVKTRVLPAHDIKDAQPLLKKLKTNIAVLDKAYDANKLHIFCNEQNIEAHIPIREYGKSRHQRWTARRKAVLHFRKSTYNRRVLIESGFSSIKRKFGDSVSSKQVKTVRADLYGRLLAHNLFGCFKEI